MPLIDTLSGRFFDLPVATCSQSVTVRTGARQYAPRAL
jgi:hypothetical protein